MLSTYGVYRFLATADPGIQQGYRRVCPLVGGIPVSDIDPFSVCQRQGGRRPDCHPSATGGNIDSWCQERLRQMVQGRQGHNFRTGQLHDRCGFRQIRPDRQGKPHDRFRPTGTVYLRGNIHRCQRVGDPFPGGYPIHPASERGGDDCRRELMLPTALSSRTMKWLRSRRTATCGGGATIDTTNVTYAWGIKNSAVFANTTLTATATAGATTVTVASVTNMEAGGKISKIGSVQYTISAVSASTKVVTLTSALTGKPVLLAVRYPARITMQCWVPDGPA